MGSAQRGLVHVFGVLMAALKGTNLSITKGSGENKEFFYNKRIFSS